MLYCDEDTSKVIHNVFATMNIPEIRIAMGHCQKQKGEVDCGVFSIAIARALAFDCTQVNKILPIIDEDTLSSLSI